MVTCCSYVLPGGNELEEPPDVALGAGAGAGAGAGEDDFAGAAEAGTLTGGGGNGLLVRLSISFSTILRDSCIESANLQPFACATSTLLDILSHSSLVLLRTSRLAIWSSRVSSASLILSCAGSRVLSSILKICSSRSLILS